jgi:monofunctional biosynthetic peptidoglycan transglycosylase
VAPSSTALQIERRLQAQLAGKSYHKRNTFVSIDRISPDFQRAIVAAEGARFYQHRGFDWTEIRNAVEDDLDDRCVRGASTITQQLVKTSFSAPAVPTFASASRRLSSPSPSSRSANAAFWSST